MVRPNIILSACLNGDNVRYDGKIVKDEFIDKLKKYTNVFPVCPEVSIGLPTPREKIILVRENNEYKAYQLPNLVDLTDRLKEFSEKFLNSLKEVDGFILKAKSPSCAFQGAKTYKIEDKKKYIGRRKGIFALQVLDRYKNYPLSDEIDLQDWYKRYIFLTKLFLFAQYRTTKNKKEFITKNKKILELFNKKRAKEFQKSPTKENFLKIFNTKLTEKIINNKIPNFKERIEKDKSFSKDYVIFPEELLFNTPQQT